MCCRVGYNWSERWLSDRTDRMDRIEAFPVHKDLGLHVGTGWCIGCVILKV
jgi:hypothetical protein